MAPRRPGEGRFKGRPGGPALSGSDRRRRSGLHLRGGGERAGGQRHRRPRPVLPDQIQIFGRPGVDRSLRSQPPLLPGGSGRPRGRKAARSNPHPPLRRRLRDQNRAGMASGMGVGPETPDHRGEQERPMRLLRSTPARGGGIPPGSSGGEGGVRPPLQEGVQADGGRSRAQGLGGISPGPRQAIPPGSEASSAVPRCPSPCERGEATHFDGGYLRIVRDANFSPKTTYYLGEAPLSTSRILRLRSTPGL